MDENIWMISCKRGSISPLEVFLGYHTKAVKTKTNYERLRDFAIENLKTLNEDYFSNKSPLSFLTLKKLDNLRNKKRISFRVPSFQNIIPMSEAQELYVFVDDLFTASIEKMVMDDIAGETNINDLDSLDATDKFMDSDINKKLVEIQEFILQEAEEIYDMKAEQLRGMYWGICTDIQPGSFVFEKPAKKTECIHFNTDGRLFTILEDEMEILSNTIIFSSKI